LVAEGDILATAGLHGRLTLWDPKDLSVLKELSVPEWTISIKFSPDGRASVRRRPTRRPRKQRKSKSGVCRKTKRLRQALLAGELLPRFSLSTATVAGGQQEWILVDYQRLFRGTFHH